MKYKIGQKVRLVAGLGWVGLKSGSVGEIIRIDWGIQRKPINVKFGALEAWPPVGTFELIEDEPDVDYEPTPYENLPDEARVDLTKIDTPFGLLDEDTQQRLEDWPYGVERWDTNGWIASQVHRFYSYLTYRAKPAPERKAVWMNVYRSAVGGMPRRSRELVDRRAGHDRIAVWRIEYNADGSDPEIFVEDV